MKIHHLNCATMCPLGGRLVNGHGSVFSAAEMICHCLLIESPDGLVLVDTGFGLADIAHARDRLNAPFRTLVRPRLDPAETAARQIERLGFARHDVRHIVLTHLDLDHAGGLSDFPTARVHVSVPEHDAAQARSTRAERERYVPSQWAHAVDWALHPVEGERWFGFDRVRAIAGVGPEVLLVPLHGHTRGHMGVAVHTSGGWLLHAGDAYFFHGEMDAARPHCTPALATFQRLLAFDDDARRANQRRLHAVARDHAAEVTVFSAHDPIEFARDYSRHAAAVAPSARVPPVHVAH